MVDRGLLPRGQARPCPYLAGRVARDRAFEADRLDPELYQSLMDRGFRRSGTVFYATDCPGCRACVPIRVPVAGFRPSRSQRRAALRNRDVQLRVAAPEFTPERFALYRRYLRHQHGDSAGLETAGSFAESFYRPVVDTREATYWLGERLVAVSIVDVCRSSVSSVYHFFDPAAARRSLGVFSVVAEIGWAAQQGIPWYYLGFWIEGAPTMHYKADYRPHELLRHGRWSPAP
ncbi:MAG: arginyltransferase [Planctomycetes bacterium]|nr:arginyltransferase [Planctomycetota bacterium]